jgi:hypothetical protein
MTWMVPAYQFSSALLLGALAVLHLQPDCHRPSVALGVFFAVVGVVNLVMAIAGLSEVMAP